MLKRGSPGETRMSESCGAHPPTGDLDAAVGWPSRLRSRTVVAPDAHAPCDRLQHLPGTGAARPCRPPGQRSGLPSDRGWIHSRWSCASKRQRHLDDRTAPRSRHPARPIAHMATPELGTCATTSALGRVLTGQRCYCFRPPPAAGPVMTARPPLRSPGIAVQASAQARAGEVFAAAQGCPEANRPGYGHDLPTPVPVATGNSGCWRGQGREARGA